LASPRDGKLDDAYLFGRALLPADLQVLLAIDNRTRQLVYTSLISTNHSRNKRIFNVNVIELPVFQDLDIFACK
jgi:hypothetical protein